MTNIHKKSSAALLAAGKTTLIRCESFFKIDMAIILATGVFLVD